MHGLISARTGNIQQQLLVNALCHSRIVCNHRAIERRHTQPKEACQAGYDHLVSLLAKQGIVVARRTIAKYREAMQIPPVNQRKSL